MSWVTVIWSISAGACLTLAFLQFIVWCKDRAARANLGFALGAVAVAVFAGMELALMRAETPAQFGTVARWIHVPGWVLIVSIVAFVRLYLNAGRRDDPSVRRIAMNAGASAFLIKGMESGEFLAGVKAAGDSGN